MVASMVRAHLAASDALFGQSSGDDDFGMGEALALLRDMRGDAPEIGSYELPPAEG
jgi:hypothetical protein